MVALFEVRDRLAASPVAVRLAILVVMSALIVAGCGGEGNGSSENEQPVAAEADAPSATAGEAERGAAVSEGQELPRLIDLGADKCVPCKMMAPILDEMTETFAGQLEVQFIDVWKDASAGREYGVKVIPTQVFLDEEGNELFRHQGFFSREDMLAKWTELGYEFNE